MDYLGIAFSRLLAVLKQTYVLHCTEDYPRFLGITFKRYPLWGKRVIREKLQAGCFVLIYGQFDNFTLFVDGFIIVYYIITVNFILVRTNGLNSRLSCRE